MALKLILDTKTESKRFRYWQKYGKSKNNYLEYVSAFDLRVYKLGLEVLKKNIKTKK